MKPVKLIGAGEQTFMDRWKGSAARGGVPVGSGVTEGTAKKVVNMCAKRSGQRWSVEDYVAY